MGGGGISPVEVVFCDSPVERGVGGDGSSDVGSTVVLDDSMDLGAGGDGSSLVDCSGIGCPCPIIGMVSFRITKK